MKPKQPKGKEVEAAIGAIENFYEQGEELRRKHPPGKPHKIGILRELAERLHLNYDTAQRPGNSPIPRTAIHDKN
jgi:hypothetical protein